MPLEEFESDDGIVIKEHDGQGPNYYTVYHRTENDPYLVADKVEIGDNATIVYGKVVLFGPVRAETYPHKGQTRVKVTPLEDGE